MKSATFVDLQSFSFGKMFSDDANRNKSIKINFNQTIFLESNNACGAFFSERGAEDKGETLVCLFVCQQECLYRTVPRVNHPHFISLLFEDISMVFFNVL